jgi:hypothetical protein
MFEGAGARRLRARRLRRLVIVLGVLAVALVIVALLPQDRRSGSLAVPTSARSGDGKATGVVQGVLHGARSGNRACFTVEALQGHVILVLPPGWSADADLRLLDAYGQTRVKAGVSTSFLGTPGAFGAVPGCAAPGRLWYTTDVRRPLSSSASS